jgi:NAD(P)-dependent dehydrogenase (short-subunit alcohol dehydrogenase family)
MQMQERVAIVTGGAGVVGSALVSLLLEEGAVVVVADRVAPPPARKLTYVETNVSNESSVRVLMEGVVAEQGRIDALFNVAGGFRYGPAVDELAEADWDAMMELNLKSAFLCIKHVLPVMKRQNYGRIVSVAARPGLKGEGMLAPYAVSKGGVILLTQSVADEVKDFDITANCVMPSVVDTPANRQSMPGADFSNWVAPLDLAEVMVFLGSGRSRAVSGAAVPVYNKA